MKNTLKEKLARGEQPLGTFVNTGSAAVVECLGCTGLDFVILDNEHSPLRRRPPPPWSAPPNAAD